MTRMITPMMMWTRLPVAISSASGFQFDFVLEGKGLLRSRIDVSTVI
jgi:hypothetical protein